MLYLLQQLLNGLHIGAIYALLGFGYALINGVLHRPNLAHGALFGFAGQTMILGAVFGWQVLWLTLPASLTLGALAALVATLLASAVLSKSVLEPLARRSSSGIVAATLAASLVLMELSRIAADTRDFWLPPVLAEPVRFAGGSGFAVTLTVLQLIDLGLALTLLLALSWALTRSGFGRAWRAVSDDPRAAALCGVDGSGIFRRAVLGGGALAAAAGVMAALHYGNIGFGAGLVFGLKVLFVTAVGGYSHPPRAALGAAIFGIAESLWSGYFAIEWRDTWVFAILIAILVLRADDEPLPKEKT